jgi:competence protein ComEC
MRGSVLWPDTIAEVTQATNDDSLVLRFDFGNESMLLAGDIEKPVERALVAVNAPLEATFLKAPHHGSATSSSADFVEALKPRVALLSAGQTTKVSDEVLRRYQDVGAALYRTDAHGAITLDTDGREVRVTTFTGERAVFRSRR